MPRSSTTWTKGTSGNPKGRASTGELFRVALKRAINEDSLRNMVNRLIEQAEAGDLSAIREVADRLDGKPFTAQYIEISTGDGTPLPVEELIDRYNRLGKLIENLKSGD